MKKSYNHIFLTTSKNNTFINLLSNACLNHEYSITKKKYKVIRIDDILTDKISVIYKLKAAIETILFYFNRNRIKKKYHDIGIYRYAIAASYRSYKSYNNKKVFLRSLYLNIQRAIKLVYSLKKQRFDVAFIDHAVYLNGIVLEHCLKKNIPIYHYHYPYDIDRVVNSSGKTLQDILMVEKLEKENSVKLGETIQRRRIVNNEMPNYVSISKTKKVLESKIASHVIYCHSFTDAQLIYGFDNAFINMKDWLIYTVKQLKNRNIIIKAHPNIYSKYKSKVVDWDRDIFNEIIKNYKKIINIELIDYPLNNIQFLKNLNKNSILVSHHGNSLLEGGFMGFKCICSSNTPWNKFDIFNTWKNKSEYKKLLSRRHYELEDTNINNLCEYIYLRDSHDNSYFKVNNWRDIASKYAKVSRMDIIRDPTILLNLQDEIKKDMIYEISESISRKVI